MLEEGKDTVQVVKETTTPDKKDYWVLSGPGERRFLMPVKYYRGMDLNGVRNKMQDRQD
jgi:hypothetical protein